MSELLNGGGTDDLFKVVLSLLPYKFICLFYHGYLQEPQPEGESFNGLGLYTVLVLNLVAEGVWQR